MSSVFASLRRAFMSAAKYGMSAASLDTSAMEARKIRQEISDLIEEIGDLERVLGKSKRSGSPSRELDKEAGEAILELEKLKRELKDKRTLLEANTNPEKYEHAEVLKQPRGEANLAANCRDVASKDSKEPLYPEGVMPEVPKRHMDNELAIKSLQELYTDIDGLYNFFTEPSKKDETSLKTSTEKFDKICKSLLSRRFDTHNPFRPGDFWKYNKTVQIYVVYILKKILIIHYTILKMDSTGEFKGYRDYTQYLHGNDGRKPHYKDGKYFLYNIEPGYYRNNSTSRANHRDNGSRSRSRSRNRNSNPLQNFRMRLILANNYMTIEKLMYIFEKILCEKDFRFNRKVFINAFDRMGFEKYFMELLLTTKMGYADTTKGSFKNCFILGTFEKVKFRDDNNYTKAIIPIINKGYDDVVTEIRKLDKEFKTLKDRFDVVLDRNGRVTVK